MSITCIAFLLIYFFTLLKSFRSPAWAVSLYLVSFFMTPAYWWWGLPIRAVRWNLLSAIVLLVSVLVSSGALNKVMQHRPSRNIITMMFLLAINATFVHFVLATEPSISQKEWVIILKTSLLLPLFMAAIRDRAALKVVVFSLVMGAAYIGFEATINDRGRIVGNRLEGVGVANAGTANDLACLMVSIAAFIAPLFLQGTRFQKLSAMVAGVFILNVILMCNSRGAFLALIGLGALFLALAPRTVRPMAIKVACLGVVAGWLLLGDPRIVERFFTTFSSVEELDTSAASRLDFWKAGAMMVTDYPLGAGGDSFRDVHGITYIEKVTGEPIARSVHQGYLKEACNWGIQGLLLRLGVLCGGAYCAFRSMRQSAADSNLFLTLTSLAVLAGMSGLLVQSLFGSFLKAEWGLWMAAIGASCYRLSDESADPGTFDD